MRKSLLVLLLLTGVATAPDVSAAPIAGDFRVAESAHVQPVQYYHRERRYEWDRHPRFEHRRREGYWRRRHEWRRREAFRHYGRHHR